jgi:serine/threonine-protein kinase
LTAANRTFGGRYSVIELVGSGGMAEVYRARDELLGREVAIKVLHERFAGDRSFVERFKREAQSAANLNHPNIVSLYDYGTDDGAYYIVMELIEGRSLAQIIKSEGPLLPERAAEVASDVAKALSRAHTAGIVHRDVKPGNIMITSTGQTKVTDFGIARALGGEGDQTMTQTGMVIGTAAYLSPEQAQGDPVDTRSDVYSLGVVLYEALTGSPPFTGESPLSVAYKHVREAPRPPSEVNVDVPAALNSITMKALAKNPDNRYANAGELQEDLARFMTGTKVHATPMMDETMVAPATGTQVMSQTDLYDEEPDRGRGLRYALIALLILAIVGIGAFFLADNLFGGDPVDVPEVVGLTEDDARAELADVGLEAKAERKPSKRAVGIVFKTEPEEGAEVEEGDEVTIFVSTGPREVAMPDVTGIPLPEARDVIEEEGLVVGDITRSPSDEEEGIVTGQSFPADAQVQTGTEIDLEVSSGPQLTAPDVVGMSEDEAVATLDEAGLQADVVTEPSDQEAGIVIAQEPGAGVPVEEGDFVQIVVSEGPQEEEMPGVVGQDADEAESSLESEFGLDVTQVDETEPCAEPPGVVCRQDPEEGEPVSEGDDVTLYVQPGDASLPDLGFATLFFGLFS